VIRNRNKGGNDLVSWRCKRCQAYKSVKENSFFSLFKKSVWFIITLIKYWCIQLPLASAIDLIKLEEEKSGINCSLPVICKLYKFLRFIICSKSIIDTKIQLGGANKDVEIDELLVAKVNHDLNLRMFLIINLIRLNIMWGRD
jgi:hypothetical protein